MIVGWVPEQWARRERPRWWAEEIAARSGVPADAEPESATAGGDVEAGVEEWGGEAGARTREMPVGD
jgi:hypothetical protein